MQVATVVDCNGTGDWVGCLWDAVSASVDKQQEPELWHAVQYWWHEPLLLIGADVEDHYDPLFDESHHSHSVVHAGLDLWCVWTIAGGWGPQFIDGRLMLCSSTGDTANYAYIYVDHDDFAFAEHEFTVEFWAYIYPTLDTPNVLVTNETPVGATAHWSLMHRQDWPNNSILELRVGSHVIQTGNDWPVDYTPQWVHIALVRSGDRGLVFIDGTPVIDEPDLFDGISFATTADRKVSFGGWSYGTTPPWTNGDGYWDEIRVTRGARYLSSFTPQWAKFMRPEYPGYPQAP